MFRGLLVFLTASLLAGSTAWAQPAQSLVLDLPSPTGRIGSESPNCIWSTAPERTRGTPNWAFES
ncbi:MULTISPECIES: hypothetical protein [unclassified Amycolatopsis]|uniref:hypothetical protein n=1 Tax=unclassified Amycolatopsis TaxID=2618356 RepID=UPI001F0EAA4D|nr:MULTISPECIES: hypothetical protein [unclassified Amycolatopsis]